MNTEFIRKDITVTKLNLALIQNDCLTNFRAAAKAFAKNPSADNFTIMDLNAKVYQHVMKNTRSQFNDQGEIIDITIPVFNTPWGSACGPLTNAAINTV